VAAVLCPCESDPFALQRGAQRTITAASKIERLNDQAASQKRTTNLRGRLLRYWTVIWHSAQAGSGGSTGLNCSFAALRQYAQGARVSRRSRNESSLPSTAPSET
jgi:hypothetical protein